MDILVVGDFTTNKDLEEGGAWRSGLSKMFKSWMRQSGIDPRQCSFVNVFDAPPKGRQSIYGFCGPKDAGIPRVKFLKRGSYVLAEYETELHYLWKRINTWKPNLIIAAGELALWALTSEGSLKNARGRIHSGHSGIPERKILPVYGPGSIVGDWSQRPILLADLEKAARESLFPEIRRPRRLIHLYPSVEDLEEFLNNYILPSTCTDLDVDIETKGEVITCIGFAPNPNRALVVPFYDASQPDGNYWRTKREEYLAWQWVKRVLRLPGKKVCGQNLQYDVQYLWRQMGIKLPTFTNDTMLLHHALHPEMSKGLGFLASVYTDELPWKFMHKQAANAKGAKKGDAE